MRVAPMLIAPQPFASTCAATVGQASGLRARTIGRRLGDKSVRYGIVSPVSGSMRRITIGSAEQSLVTWWSGKLASAMLASADAIALAEFQEALSRAEGLGVPLDPPGVPLEQGSAASALHHDPFVRVAARMVLSGVIADIKQFKVLKPVVRLDLVSVVNVLGPLELAAKMPFHNHTMS
jgi:hypothetical protein